MAAMNRLVGRGRPMARLHAALVAALLVPAACSGAGDTAEAPEPGGLGDGSLGTVEVPAGEAIQIRSLNTITGDVAYLGIPNQRGVELAVADFGAVNGFDVDLGTRYDDLCSSDGAQAAAQTIVADEEVVGVIGPSCSTAAVAGLSPDHRRGHGAARAVKHVAHAHLGPGRQPRPEPQRRLLPDLQQRPVRRRGHGPVRL